MPPYLIKPFIWSKTMSSIQEKKDQIIKTNAFYNTSWDPEKRIKHFAEEFEREHFLIVEICTKYGVDAEKFLDKHFRLSMDYLSAESRCASAAVVGFAKFPVARMEKKVNSAMNKLSRLNYFLDNMEKTLIKITRPKETEDDKKNKWTLQLEELKARQEMMKQANALLRKKDIEGLVALVGEEQARKLQIPDFAGRVGYPDYKLANNLANIKRLESQIDQINKFRDKNVDDYVFEGGHVEYDPEEIRFNIFFDDKPDEETRSRLKSRGFKWSPRRGAWTRGAKTITMKTIKELLSK